MLNLTYLRIASIVFLSALISACGSPSTDSETNTSDVSIRFSDTPVDDLDVVMISVDKLIFNRSGEDIVIDTFTSEELNIIDSDTFQLNLLDFQGLESSLVLDSVILPVGDYQNLRIAVEVGENTYVQESGSTEHKELKVPSGELKLGSFSVSNLSSQTFVIEFGLRQAMTYNPGPKRYILKPRGVRIVRLADASSISGNVDLTTPSCLPTEDSTLVNIAYLYKGHDLDASLLGDVLVREEELDSSESKIPGTDYDSEVADNIIAPIVSSAIEANGNYFFSYLNEGNYTVAISCNSQEDNATIYDGITIPTPAGHIVELSLEKESNMSCDFIEGFEVGACSELTLIPE